MTLQTSGQMALSQIAAEWGGSGQLNMNNYHAGVFVTAGATGTNGAVPSSGQLAFWNLFGTSNIKVRITAKVISVTGGSGAGATASVNVLNSGVLSSSTSAGYSGEWKVSGAVGDYDVYATTSSGSAPSTSSGMDVWLNCGTTRTWTNSVTATGGTRTSNLTISFRNAVGGAFLTSAAVTITAIGGGSGGCVVLGSYLQHGYKVEDASLEAMYATHTPGTPFDLRKIISRLEPSSMDCVTLCTESGATLTCSNHTPFNLEDAQEDMDAGDWRYAEFMQGHKVMVMRRGVLYWDRVVSVLHEGKRMVVPLNFDGRSFAAGNDPDALIFSHNTAKVII